MCPHRRVFRSSAATRRASYALCSFIRCLTHVHARTHARTHSRTQDALVGLLKRKFEEAVEAAPRDARRATEAEELAILFPLVGERESGLQMYGRYASLHAFMMSHSRLNTTPSILLLSSTLFHHLTFASSCLTIFLHSFYTLFTLFLHSFYTLFTLFFHSLQNSL
jgi:hypothetical protein